VGNQCNELLKSCTNREHLTETCEEDRPHLITNVETTIGTTPDMVMTEVIHQHLDEKGLLPSEHVVDAGYVDAEALVKSEKEHQIKLTGPVQVDHSWQSRHSPEYMASCFAIDWKAQKVTCPQGEISRKWVAGKNEHDGNVIFVEFGKASCRSCLKRASCTQAKEGPRGLTLKPKEEYEALQVAREQQKTKEWKADYDLRAGVEGTISQGVQSFGMRKCRYAGLAKTGLQHFAEAAAMNLARMAAWLEEKPLAQTRTSAFARLVA